MIKGWVIRDPARLMLEMRGVKDKGKRDMLGLESTYFILFKIEAVKYMSLFSDLYYLAISVLIGLVL